MLPEAIVVIRGIRRHGSRCEALRLGIGIAVERWFAETPVTWPKAATADFVRVCFLHDPGTQIRRRTGNWGGCASGEAGDRHVEAAQKKCTGLTLPRNCPRTGSRPDPPEPGSAKIGDVFRVVRTVRAILFEWDGVGYLDRHGPDLRLHPKSPKTTHNLRVKVRNGSRAENHCFDCPFTCLERKGMVDEIEIDLKTRAAVGMGDVVARGRSPKTEPATSG